jgi:hypothetical protein
MPNGLSVPRKNREQTGIVTSCISILITEVDVDYSEHAATDLRMNVGIGDAVIYMLYRTVKLYKGLHIYSVVYMGY